MYGHKVELDTARIHDFGCIDERRKHLDEQDESTRLTISRGPVQARWSPYVDNGGTALAIAGKGYVLIAADTRMSLGYSIESRDSSKMTQLTKNCVIATCGMQADRATFHKNIGIRLRFYEHRNQGRTPGVKAVASLVSTMLYNRRFFPFYCFNLVCGLQDDGNGVVYGYDAVGCIEAQPYGSSGSAHEMVEPYLDTKIRRQHDRKPGEDWEPPTLEEARKMTESIFHAVAERDIYTGDKVEVIVITKDGATKDSFDIRKD